MTQPASQQAQGSAVAITGPEHRALRTGPRAAAPALGIKQGSRGAHLFPGHVGLQVFLTARGPNSTRGRAGPPNPDPASSPPDLPCDLVCAWPEQANGWKDPWPVLGARRCVLRAPGRSPPGAHWQHSATCRKSSSPCSSLKSCRQCGHCRSPWPLRAVPGCAPFVGLSSRWDPVPGRWPPGVESPIASVSRNLGVLVPVWIWQEPGSWES